MPPTTPAMRPAASGAPEATAMPSERGTATRKTTREAGRSCLSTEPMPPAVRTPSLFVSVSMGQTLRCCPSPPGRLPEAFTEDGKNQR